MYCIFNFHSPKPLLVYINTVVYSLGHYAGRESGQLPFNGPCIAIGKPIFLVCQLAQCSRLGGGSFSVVYSLRKLSLTLHSFYYCWFGPDGIFSSPPWVWPCHQDMTIHVHITCCRVISFQLTVQCYRKKKAPCKMFNGHATRNHQYAYFTPTSPSNSNLKIRYEWSTLNGRTPFISKSCVWTSHHCCKVGEL